MRSPPCAAPTAGTHIDVSCLPAELHNRPEKIAAAVRAQIHAPRGPYRSIFVAYGDCGTGGLLDAVLREEGIERIPGAHCYEFFATGRCSRALAEAELGTFYLTDFLLRHFERLVIAALGLDRHPELPELLRALQKLVYLAQARTRRDERGARIAGAWASSSNITIRATATSGAVAKAALRATTRCREEKTNAKRRPHMAALIVISWRDIPAQSSSSGGAKLPRYSSQRLQEAVDRAATRAGKGSSDAYLADWKRSAPRPWARTSTPRRAAEAATLEAHFSDEDLERLIRAKGLGTPAPQLRAPMYAVPPVVRAPCTGA